MDKYNIVQDSLLIVMKIIVPRSFTIVAFTLFTWTPALDEVRVIARKSKAACIFISKPGWIIRYQILKSSFIIIQFNAGIHHTYRHAGDVLIYVCSDLSLSSRMYLEHIELEATWFGILCDAVYWPPSQQSILYNMLESVSCKSDIERSRRFYI